MLVLLLHGMVFLVLGAAVFVAMAVVPYTRRYALSGGLWCAVWGPCLVGFEMLAGLSLAAQGLAAKEWNVAVWVPPLPAWGAYMGVALIATICLATAAAWVHQALIHRMAFALFRMYAAAVIAGIGSVFGWGLWLSLAISGGMRGGLLVSAVALVALTAVFGWGGYRWAAGFRGPRPEGLQWISKAEFGAP